MNDYAHPETLASTDWVARHKDQPNVRLVEVNVDTELYEQKHIPGAANIPWSMAVNDEDGTFKPREELQALYQQAGITGEKPIISYCRIGERSSHSWFVLKYLLGINNVKNYDGSWTEWGNLVGVDVETGTAKTPVQT